MDVGPSLLTHSAVWLVVLQQLLPGRAQRIATVSYSETGGAIHKLLLLEKIEQPLPTATHRRLRWTARGSWMGSTNAIRCMAQQS